MANEFKVKNGIRFPDDTVQTTAATGGGGGSSTLTISNKTSAYTVVIGDLGTIINCTSGTFTVSLTAAATLGNGFNCWVWNTSASSADVITIDPNGSETIDGRSTLVLRTGEGMQIVCDGTNWQTGDKKTMRAYAENQTSDQTRPVASGAYSVAIGVSATASGSQSFAIGRFVTASGDTSLAIGCDSTAASGARTTAIGSSSGSQGAKAVTGSGAMALGGSYASGTDSLAAAVANNTSSYGATGATSFCFGYLSKSNGTSSLALGYTAVASGSYARAIGYGAVANNTNATAIGGWWNYGAPTASGTSSIAIGDGAVADGSLSVALGNAAITNSIKGKYAYSNGRFAANGDSQIGTYVLRRLTTNTTATVLTTDDSSPGSDDQIVLPNNSAFAYTGLVVARKQASTGTDSAAWKIDGLIRREGSASTTVLVNNATTVIDNTPGWDLAVSADTSNGCLRLTVTGAASTNIRWIATIQTSEVTYA